MSASTTTPQVLHAEQEHPRLRIFVVIALLVVYALCFFLLRALIQFAPGELPSFAISLSCLLSAPIALGVVWGFEKWLKSVWPSGYNLVLGDEQLQVNQPELEPLAFSWAAPVDLLGWYFSLRGYKRGGPERRVPDSWLCLACQVQQADTRLIVFTYAAPAKAEQYVEGLDSVLEFHKINPVEVYSQTLSSRFQPPSRPHTIPAQVLTGKDGRFWLA
ncbi:MAG: hypothetical protein KC441_13575, partial [Anaerolineales bacterium]|nr:hypothetical protein [Anaerolineales bacterium]